MHRYTRHAQGRHLRRRVVEAAGFAPGHAEFVFFFAGGNFNVRQRVHVRINAYGHIGPFAQPLRHLRQQLHFFGRFHVNLAYAVPHGGLQLRFGFAHAGENDFVRRHAGFERQIQFPAGHHVRPAAHGGNRAHHGQVGVGFDRITHRRMKRRQRAHIGAEIIGQLALGITIKRRADLLRQFFQIYLLYKQRSVLVMKRHASSL